MTNSITIAGIIAFVLIGGAWYLSKGEERQSVAAVLGIDTALAAQFEHLRAQTTNSCGGGASIVYDRPSDGRLQGSCCFPMDAHGYKEQIEGLAAKFSAYEIIPPDPYDIPVAWGREMIEYNGSTELTPEQQSVYDEAVELSHEGGPCCCVCWHWYAYEGLAKHLIINENFSAEQVAEVWDLSDACGGEHNLHH